MNAQPYEVCPACGHTNQAALAALSSTATALADAAYAYARIATMSPTRIRLIIKLLDEGTVPPGDVQPQVRNTVITDRVAFINPDGLLQLTGWGYALARYYKEPPK